MTPKKLDPVALSNLWLDGETETVLGTINSQPGHIAVYLGACIYDELASASSDGQYAIDFLNDLAGQDGVEEAVRL